MRQYLLIISILCLGSPSKAQFNIGVSYELFFPSIPQNNNLLRQFDSAKEMELGNPLTSTLSSLNSVHGIGLALNYGLGDLHSVELAWSFMGRTLEAVGETSDESVFQQKLFYRSRPICLSYIYGREGIGFGIGAGINQIAIKDEIGNSDVKKTLIDEGLAFSRFIISWNLPRGRNSVKFSIQAYYKLSLESLNYSALAEELGLQDSNYGSDKFSGLGLRFIFYNGPTRN